MAETDEHRLIHHAVLRRDEPMVRALMQAGADARKGIFPRREATTAWLLAKEREFPEIVAAIEQEEQFQRESMSCPNVTVSPAQDELTALIRKGDTAAALAMLAADPGLARACDREGGTALHIACEEGNLELAAWLMDHSANPRRPDLAGWTPLDRAVLAVRWKSRARRAAFPGIARRLLRSGAEMTPLVATALGDLDELRRLHAAAPKSLGEIHHRHVPGPLTVAVAFGQREALKLLLDLGLDADERHRLPNLEEEVTSWGSPLWHAAAFGECEMAALLLDRGADPRAQVYASGSPADRAYDCPEPEMRKLLARHGATASPYTIGLKHDIEAARALLAGAPDDQTMHDLLWGAGSGGDPRIVALCLEKIDWPLSDPRFRRLAGAPLSMANHGPLCDHPELFDRSGYAECFRLLIRHGIDVSSAGYKGETLLHTIVAAGLIWGQQVMTEEERDEFTRIVLSVSPDLTLRDQILKSTPLGWACRWGREGMARLLLDHGAPANEPDAEPWATPLAWARKMGYSKIERMLREKGATR
jgi:ankyrin repeat protein